MDEASTGRKAVSELLGDRYETIRKLGSGAFGEVYEATDRSLHRKVAIKRIRLDAFAEGPEIEEVKERFVREAQVAAQLRHPNIVTIHDIAAKGGSSFMVMELVQGRTLQALLAEKGRLGLEETLGLLSQAAAALDYAHENGVVHRDVKPANLMIEPTGHLKVMDFGIAKAQSSGDITRTGTILGTPNYMSPEQARGGTVDGRADLFSLGCILYECLAGRKPFAGDSVTTILLKILNEPPPPIDLEALKLPAPLADVLRRALAKNSAERYGSGKELIEAARRASRDAAPTVVGARTAAADSSLAPTLPATAALPAVAAPAVPAAMAPPAVAAEKAGLAPPRPKGASFPWGKVAVVAAAVVVLVGFLWTANASLRAPRAALSPHVTEEQPGVVGRLLGSKPTLHVTVPQGSAFAVRLETPLSSETAQADQEFTASMNGPLLVDGVVAVPAGSRVKGHVSHAAGSGKVSGRGELTLEFDRILTPGGAAIPIEAEPFERRARSTVKKDAGKVAGGAGLGAIVGGIFGGKKGALIGGAVGASAGTGVVLSTKGEEVVLAEGAPLEIRLRSPFTVTVERPSR